MNDILGFYLGVSSSSLNLFNRVCTNPDDIATADTFWHTRYLELKQSSISETIGTLPIVNKNNTENLFAINQVVMVPVIRSKSRPEVTQTGTTSFAKFLRNVCYTNSSCQNPPFCVM